MPTPLQLTVYPISPSGAMVNGAASFTGACGFAAHPAVMANTRMRQGFNFIFNVNRVARPHHSLTPGERVRGGNGHRVFIIKGGIFAMPVLFYYQAGHIRPDYQLFGNSAPAINLFQSIPHCGWQHTRSYQSGVSFAYSSASHLAPAFLKFTCTRISAPLPSMLRIIPSPNLA